MVSKKFGFEIGELYRRIGFCIGITPISDITHIAMDERAIGVLL
jgi:hypothetical protein